MARALGVTRSAISERITATVKGPTALRYLSVLLLCSEEALTAQAEHAVRLAWRPGVEADRWLPIVAAIIHEGRPLPTFEQARQRVLDGLADGGKHAERTQDIGFIAGDS